MVSSAQLNQAWPAVSLLLPHPLDTAPMSRPTMNHRSREPFHPSDSRSRPRQRTSKIPDVQGGPPSQPYASQAEHGGWTDHEHHLVAEHRNFGEAFAPGSSRRHLAHYSPLPQPIPITSERESDNVSREYERGCTQSLLTRDQLHLIPGPQSLVQEHASSSL
jgi:hypothetical protein